MTRVKLKIPREVFSREDTTEYAVKVARAGVTYEYKRGTSMLNVVILWIFSCGIELGVIVLCLLPLRFILRRKVPRLFSYLLWAALPVCAGVNFCIRKMPNLSREIADYLDEIDPLLISRHVFEVLKWCWLFGSIMVWIIMLVYFIRLQVYLVGSIRLHDNIYLCSRIDIPFTMGLFKPRIYLPSAIEEAYYESIILHEQVHIKRKDIWMKYLAIGLLALFWFQPVLWLAYHLYINDMEEACDETVIRTKGEEFRADYARVLYEVTFQTRKERGLVLGYGNGAIKERIRHAAEYKNESKKVCIIALLICVLFIIVTIPISWQVPRLILAEQRIEIIKETTMSIGKQSIDDRLIEPNK